MNRLLLICIVAIVQVVCVKSNSDVLELHDADFDSKINQHEIALVKFYAPWCGHCKRLAPDFDKAATELKRNDPPVSLIKVDCTVETQTCAKYDVKGYPTLKIFKNGQLGDEYQGPRDANGIVNYMKAKAGPVSRQLENLEDVQSFLDNYEHSVIGFFSQPNGHLEREFLKVAGEMSENHRFAHTFNPSVLEKYKHYNEIVIYQPPRLHVKLEPIERVYSGQADVTKIRSFIQDEFHGLAGHRTVSNEKEFQKRPLVVVYFNCDFLKDVKGANYVRNRVIKVAQKLKEEKINVYFAISNINEFRSELGEYGYEEASSEMKIIAGRGPNNEKFKFDGEFSVENLEKFARDLVANRLEAFLKSEPIPSEEEVTKEAVRQVVAKNFNQIVNDNSKDVLIEFYAPWCGHCKSLAPKYEELARKLKDETGIVIAKIDATANDIPAPYDVRGFPTIYFAKKNEKQNPHKYEGGREVDDFVKYIAKHATDPLTNYDRSGKKSKKTDL